MNIIPDEPIPYDETRFGQAYRLGRHAGIADGIELLFGALDAVAARRAGVELVERLNLVARPLVPRRRGHRTVLVRARRFAVAKLVTR
jgi:hypothetical protein